MISCVFGVTSERELVESKRNSFSSRSGTGTGVAPTKLIIDS